MIYDFVPKLFRAIIWSVANASYSRNQKCGQSCMMPLLQLVNDAGRNILQEPKEPDATPIIDFPVILIPEIATSVNALS
jgi:hypothetical protein